MKEEKREIQAPPNKQLIMDIGKTKYTVNLHFKQGTGETYKEGVSREFALINGDWKDCFQYSLLEGELKGLSQQM